MACVVDEATRAVTFLYKFAKGACNRSHGVNVARLAGLPEPLLELAAAKSERLEAALEEQHLLHLAGLLASATTAEEARAVWTAAQVLPAH